MGDKRFHTFPKSISLKMNVIALLDCEVTYDEVAVQSKNPKSETQLAKR